MSTRMPHMDVQMRQKLRSVRISRSGIGTTPACVRHPDLTRSHGIHAAECGAGIEPGERALPVGRALHGGFLPGVARADSVKARLTKLRGFEADRVDETRHIGEVLLVRDIGAE